jgi:putative SOS response-associated peptidase YedK
MTAPVISPMVAAVTPRQTRRCRVFTRAKDNVSYVNRCLAEPFSKPKSFGTYSARPDLYTFTMCGRFTLRTPLSVLIDEFDLAISPDSQQWLFQPRFNIAPTQDVFVVRQSNDAGRQLASMRWGLLPSWTKDVKAAPLLNNARAETVAVKPSFRSAFNSRRCLIPSSGFFEWKREGKLKQPYYFHRADEKPIAFAGLWEQWNNIESCTIITTDANELMATIHDRMPVILGRNDYAQWLDPAGKDVGELLAPCPPDELVSYAVNPVVNNARNQGPQCVEPLH